jgi:hypothetical protein
MFKKTFYYLFLILLTLSCKQENKNDSVKNSKDTNYLKIVDSVVFSIGSKVYYKSFQTHVFKSFDTTLLYRSNFLNQSIDIIDFTNKSMINSKTFAGIQKFGGSAFIPLSKDSIFLGSLMGEIYIKNNDSLVTKNIGNKRMNEIRFYGKNPFKPIQIDNEIFLYNPANERQSESSFENRPLLSSYNLETNSLKIRNFKYPSSFYNNCWAEQQFPISFTKSNNNKIVISLSTESNMYLYDPKLDSVITEINTAKSKYINDITPYTKCDFTDVSSYFKYLKSVGRYRSIEYDSVNNVYYRIVSLPTEKKLTGQRTQDIEVPLSVIVLDENFKIITERRLPSETYDPTDYFITDRGLWLSTNNEKSNSFNENQLSYVLFQLDKDEL